MNYLVKEDNLIVAQNDKLEPKDKEFVVAKMGDEKGSTTLFSNIWTPTNSDITGTFIDCAGEFDSGGALAKVLNAKIKATISTNVEKAKILFITSEGSLDSSGSYGKNFKEALDVNAQFLNDINYFKDSIAFIVSHASRGDNTLIKVKDLISIILNNHNNLDHYKNAVRHVLEKNNIETFSRPSDESEVGNLYTPPPKWNKDQRKKIIDMVEKLEYTDIPTKNFFKVSFDANVQKQMGDALAIVKIKAGKLINNLLEQAILSNFTIFALELKPFVEYLGGLKSGKILTNLEHYIKILKWNGYFKIADASQEVEKLNEEMIVLSQFTTEHKLESEDSIKPSIKENWIVIAKKVSTKNLGSVLDCIYDDAKAIINLSGNSFDQFQSKKFVTTKGANPHSENVSANFKLLDNKYKEKEDSVNLYGNIAKYGKDVTEQVFSHSESTPYQETIWITKSEPYTVKNSYTVDANYDVINYYCSGGFMLKDDVYAEHNIHAEVRHKDVSGSTLNTIPIIMKYTGSCSVKSYYDTKNKGSYNNDSALKEYFYHTEKARGLLCPEEWFVVDKTKTEGNVSITPTDNLLSQHKSKTVTLTSKKVETELQTHYKNVSEEKTVTKYKEVIKFKDSIKQIFDTQRYNKDITKIDEDIANYRKLINEDIAKFPKGKLGNCTKEAIVSSDRFEDSSKDLKGNWQAAEYESYFSQNPDKSLEILDIDVIGGLLFENDVGMI